MNPIYTLLAIPLLIPLLRVRSLPSRETIVLPTEERVVLLGASSGIGKDLAIAYARRGAKICIVARRAESLEEVKNLLVQTGLDEARVLVVPADITNVDDLIRVRESVLKAWDGFDTLHILAGVPSTQTLMQTAGVDQTYPDAQGSSANALVFTDKQGTGLGATSLPSKQGLDELAAEARACSEINYVGTVLALACFIPTLSTTSPSPALHHLSSVAATIAAPMRAIYAATKGAALMAVESCRVECEGSGVRFLSIQPGTINNDFRKKTFRTATGGNCEVENGVKTEWDKLLLDPSAVVDSILTNLAISPKPQPFIPYPPFSWIKKLQVTPAPTVFIPAFYKTAAMLNFFPPTRVVVERNARKKYGLRP